MVKKFNEYINESLTDRMTSKPDDEVLQSLEKLKPRDALDKAIVMGFLEGVKKALPRFAANQHWYDYGIRRAAENGHVDIVKYFMEEGADNTDVALNIAFIKGHLEVFEYLLEQGADIKTIPSTRFDVYLRPAKKEKFRELFKKYGGIDESLKDQMTPKSDEDIFNVVMNKDISEVTDMLYDIYKKNPPTELLVKLADKFGIPNDFNKVTIIDILDAINFIKKYKKPHDKLEVENRVESVKSHSLNSIDSKHTYVTRVNIGSGHNGTWTNIRVLPEQEDKLYKYLNDTIFNIEPIKEWW